ncbi:uncharacterized protein LY89DRAFT_663846 [Mollisia scopiformis]|uniref:DUF6594 domain-containing protein n=1 Tax=Mollisia scopiformis TaxID=149040 RepID=A0A194XSX3_MOLSC|nr:uncharacterized protein LY89DRAFT_663846 [Mollisia scopiformis]KUJ23405.1 hypothetical protein LY89DRAFT_663846 [Mollisia scopiformis]
MDAFAAGFAWALVAMVSPLRRSGADAQQCVNSTDEEKAEQGLPSPAMNANVKRRNIANRVREDDQDGDESPATVTAGTATPTSLMEDAPESKESFVNRSWHRISSGFGSNSSLKEPRSSEESMAQIMGHDRFKHEKLEDFPDGFPKLAAFVSSDVDFGMVRNFKTLHNRLLLHDQVELTGLEKRLRELDKEDEADPKKSNYRLRRVKHKEGYGNTEQRDLLQEVRRKLNEYDTTVLNYARMQNLGQVTKRNHLSYWNFIWTTKPLFDGYWDYIYYADDFVNLSGNRPNEFHEFIQSHMVNNRWSPIRWLLRKSDVDKPTTNEAGTFYSEGKLEAASRGLMVFVVAVMLLIPSYLLFLVPMSHPKMAGVVAVFLLLFTFLISAVSKSVIEALIGIATYAAILITFLGNLSASSTCGCATTAV